MTLNTRIKDYYTSIYSNDPIGQTLDPDTRFLDIKNALFVTGEDIYDLLGDLADSVVRERIFDKLSKIMGVDYDTIYDAWLGC